MATRKCPHCAEEIQEAARVCKHCGRNIPAKLDARKSKIGLFVMAAALVTIVASNALAPFGMLGLIVGLGMNMTTRSLLLRWTGATILGLLIGGVLGAFSHPPAEAQQPPADASPETAPKFDLELLASNGSPSETGNYMYAEGQVKNVSGDSIRSVTAVVSWFTQSDDFITSDSALVEFRPLLNGQTSPFKIITSRNPAMKRFRIDFKAGGRMLSVDDRTKRK